MKSANARSGRYDEDSEIGERYIAAMQLAGRYAYTGREWVVGACARSSAAA